MGYRRTDTDRIQPQCSIAGRAEAGQDRQQISRFDLARAVHIGAVTPH